MDLSVEAALQVISWLGISTVDRIAVDVEKQTKRRNGKERSVLTHVMETGFVWGINIL